MRRIVRRGPIRPWAWLLGVLIPLGLLAGALLLASPKLLTGQWPLGIASNEVRAYTRLIGSVAEPVLTTQTLEVYRIEGAACPFTTDAGTRPITLMAGDGKYEARMVAGDEHYILHFTPGSGLKGQEAIRLSPAGPGAIKAKYLEILADELGLPVAEVSYVQLMVCGVDRGIHVKEELLGAAALTQRGISDATVFTVSSGPTAQQALFPMVTDTLMGAEMRTLWAAMYADLIRGATGTAARLIDVDMAASWLLVRWLEAAEDEGTMSFVHRRSTNRLAPLYQRSLGTPPVRSLATDPVTALLGDPALHEAMKARREKLIDERWRLKERFASMDRAWLPLLSERGDRDWTEATAARIADELIEQRLVKGDPLVWHARQWVPPGGMAAYVGVGAEAVAVAAEAVEGGVSIESLAKRFRSASVRGDTLVFGRGKFPIEGDIVLPPGKALVLEKGARLTMAPGSGITVQGPLHVRGTGLNPVFIRADDDGRPFRAIAVRADGRVRCSIAGLRMSGGGAGNVPMLAVQGAADLQVRDAELAGLAITGGSATVERSQFMGRGTLLELDHVKSRISGCTFARGGTGVVITGGRTLLQGSSFSALADRAVAAGKAAQVLLREVSMTGCGRAIDAVDLALVYLSESQLRANTVAISLRRADPVQGGARAVLHAVVLEGNTQEREVDGYSGIDQVDRMDPKVLGDFGVEAVNTAAEGAARRR